MKVIAGAIFILAAAVLFGAATIAEAVRSSNGFSGCETAVGALLAFVGIGFILAGFADRRATPRDPLLGTALRRVPKAKTTTEDEPRQGGPDSV